MKEKIFGILKHTALYSFGNIAQKGMGLITLPINAFYLSNAEFGALAILEIVMIVAAEAITLGQANSILYFNSVKEYAKEKKSIFFTITILVLLSGIVFGSAALVSQVFFPFSFGANSYFIGKLHFVVLISVLRAFNSVFLNKLRADEKSFQYTIVNLVRIIFTIGLIVLLVANMSWAITGVLFAYLVSEIACLAILIPLLVSQMEFRFLNPICVKSLKYGFPLIFSALGIYVLNLSDRFLIKLFFNLKEVGVYDFGYKIAGILQMFLILPFSQALLPSTYKEYKRPGDTRYYSKLMTYMCFVLIWGGLALSLFSDIIVSIMGQNKFNGAGIFVPIIILAYVFSSMRNVAFVGIMLSEKTVYIGILTVAAGALNVILNLLFLPKYGVITAAYTTLIAFVLFFFASKIIADKYYKITYESLKLIKLFFVGIGLYALSGFIKTNFVIADVLIKIILIIVFPVIMHGLKFYEDIELTTIRNSILKIKNPKDIKNIFNNLLSK